jgi:hypothetical protein
MLIVAATLVTSAAFATQKSYDRRFSAPAGGRLTIDAAVGSVVVIGGHTAEVSVHAKIEGSTAFVDRVHISAGQTASGVTISSRGADRDSLHGFLRWLNFTPNRVRLTVEVPRNYPVELRTAGGDVGVRNLDAPVRASTAGGDVRFRRITGNVKVHTAGGDARIEDVTGEVTLDTAGGDIGVRHLDGPADLSSSGGDIHVKDSTGSLELHTGGGDIKMQGDDGTIRAVTSGGDIRAELVANRGISLSSGSGDITLLLPPDSHASIDAESTGGDVSCDFPLSAAQVVAGSHVQGEIGGGGASISLHASGGDIHIDAEK